MRKLRATFAASTKLSPGFRYRKPQHFSSQ
nr:MAG TPA: hypothetical protein [Bacteriophage sp.]